MQGRYREIYSVTECDLLCRRYGHFSRSIQLEVWGEGALSLPAGSGQSPVGRQGCKAPGALKFLHFAVPKRGQKHLCGVFLVP